MSKLRKVVDSAKGSMQQAFLDRLRREVCKSMFKKMEPIIIGINAVIFLVSFIFTGLLTSLVLLIFKSITDTSGTITYGSLMVGLIISIIIGVLVGLLIRKMVLAKIRKTQDDILEAKFDEF